MAIVDLIMPKLGESIMEATILKWHKKPGDTVQQDETVLDIATDKVDSEVPSTAAGRIAEILFKENDVVAIGSVIAKIETDVHVEADNNDVDVPAPVGDVKEENEYQVAEEVPYTPSSYNASTNGNGNGAKVNRFYSPLVLNIASSEGISMSELENIEGTGQDGRVSKKDILAYLEKHKNSSVKEEVQTKSQPAHNVPATTERQEYSPTLYSGNVDIIEMDRMRKMIAKHMVDSKNISAHVTSFSECDVTNLVLWREKNKKEFEKREGEKITYTPLFIEAIIKCIKKYPIINSSVDGDRIIIKKDINIGMATAMPSGNLIVPVIKNADQLNLTGLTKQVNSLANAARNNKLRPDDTADGTFTLTNVGTFGSLMGTPIINQPQVAILAVGAIKKRAVVIETEQGDTIGIRHMMFLSLSYDHRIVDGSIGASFLTAVAKEFENWDLSKGW